DKWKFTSYENDSGSGETGLNYAQFRYHSSGQGRFMSADPLAGKPRNPQSLNRYSYALNDPVNLTDPRGTLTNCTPYYLQNCGWGGDYIDGSFGGGGEDMIAILPELEKDGGLGIQGGAGGVDILRKAAKGLAKKKLDKKKCLEDLAKLGVTGDQV